MPPVLLKFEAPVKLSHTSFIDDYIKDTYGLHASSMWQNQKHYRYAKFIIITHGLPPLHRKLKSNRLDKQS